jgi:hypothetical protein
MAEKFLPSFQEHGSCGKNEMIHIQAVIEGIRMKFIDDSIVRGKKLKDNTEDMRNVCQELHMGELPCPPLSISMRFSQFHTSTTSDGACCPCGAVNEGWGEKRVS